MQGISLVTVKNRIHKIRNAINRVEEGPKEFGGVKIDMVFHFILNYQVHIFAPFARVVKRAGAEGMRSARGGAICDTRRTKRCCGRDKTVDSTPYVVIGACLMTCSCCKLVAERFTEPIEMCRKKRASRPAGGGEDWRDGNCVAAGRESSEWTSCLTSRHVTS